MTQLRLELFIPTEINTPSIRYYKDLNINEKINVKVNSQMPMYCLLQARRGFNRIHPITWHDRPSEIDWHVFKFQMMHNHGGIIRQTKKELREYNERNTYKPPATPRKH